jgi:hypothetical protein
MGNRDEIESIGERIAEHAAHLDAATHRLLTDLRAFDQAGGWSHQGFKCFGGWLAWRVGWDPITAREHVRVASKLGGLPLIDDALRRGELSYSKVRAMTRVATPANQEMLLDQARYSTGAQLERICKKYAALQRHDQDTRPADDEQRRYVKRSDTADGMVKIEAVLHPEEAALVWAALERIASERCRERSASAESTTRSASAESLVLNASAESSKPDASADSSTPSGATFELAASAESPTLSSADSLKLNASAESPTLSCADSLKLDASAESPTLSSAESLKLDASADSSTPSRATFELGTSAESPTLSSADSSKLDASAESSDSKPDASAESLKARDAAGSRRVASGVRPFDRAEALVTLAQDVLRGARTDRAPTDLVVTVTADTLVGNPDAIDVGVISDGTCVSAISARRLACDCGVIDVVEDERGTPLSIGRKRRTIPGAMKRALLRRDRTCRFPGCTTRVFLEGHHLDHWADGGETALYNLASLCGHHHRYVHEYGFKIVTASSRLGESGGSELLFVDPRGRAVRDVPERPIVLDSGWAAIREGNAQLAITAETHAHGWDGSRVDYYACVDALIAVES